MERKELVERISSLDLEVKRIESCVDVVEDWINASYKATEKKKQLDSHRHFQKLLQLHDERLREMHDHQIEFRTERRNNKSKKLVRETDSSLDNELVDPADWDEYSGNSFMQDQNVEDEEDRYRPIQVITLYVIVNNFWLRIHGIHTLIIIRCIGLY